MSEKMRGGTEVSSAIRGGEARGVPKISAISGPGAGRAFAMANSIATVGRHATNDLVLNDPGVSGVHLELQRVGARLLVRDAGSTNGTWLGAHRIAQLELALGGELRIGETTLRFESDDNALPAQVSARDSFGGLVGTSTPMRELYATLERIAPKNLSVLLQGESGTGKEEAARAIHQASARAAAPFVVIDVPSLPEKLVEPLLFGYEAGAVPDTDQMRPGFFESANGGTVFIDEIGELSPFMQARVLRLLERQEVTRVGANVAAKLDVRVIASTQRDLRNHLDTRRFREDLYFRLAQVRIFLPSLRDRIDDLQLLGEKFLAEMAAGSPMTIDPDALEHLKGQPWPGNVRELRDVLGRAVATANGNVIRRVDVAGEGLGFRGTREERSALDLTGTFSEAKDRAIERFESAFLAALMKRCNGNLSLASRQADVARHHLRDLLKKRGLYGAAPEGKPDET